LCTRFQFMDSPDCAAWHDNFRGGFRVRLADRGASLDS
jgi:hypothetical protein